MKPEAKQDPLTVAGTQPRNERAPLHRLAESRWDPTLPNSIEALQVVYKVVERCNINCSYCYYFNMGDTTALTRPPIASLATSERLGLWIAQGCAELKIPRAKIAFHGGEPTLMKPADFHLMCGALHNTISHVADVSLSIQTNGTLLTDEWLAVLRQHSVSIGVSVDGGREENDRYRLNRRGQSTFDRTEKALRNLVQAAGDDERLLPSTICVLDNRNDYRRVYHYLRELGIRSMGFLLPDRNADDEKFRADGLGTEYGRCMYEIFEEWFAEDDPGIHVKFIDKVLPHFHIANKLGRAFRSPRKPNQVVIARSDGTVSIDDSYIPALDWYAGAPVYSTQSTTLRDFLSDSIFREIEDISGSLPAQCQECRWREICRGGDLENRFSSRNGFDNPSIYCDGYKLFYGEVCALLVHNGLPASVIERRFG